jgi:hypothetical protein
MTTSAAKIGHNRANQVFGADSVDSIVQELADIIGRVEDMAANIDDVRIMDVGEAAEEYVRCRLIDGAVEDLEKVITAAKEKLSKEVVPEVFNTKKCTTFTSKLGYRVTVIAACMASIKDKVRGYAWLRENEMGSLITETVNAQTLASVAKDMKSDNRDLPADIFNVAWQNRTSVTKVK